MLPFLFLVGVTRFELATSWSRTKRTTKLCHTPNFVLEYYIMSFWFCQSYFGKMFFHFLARADALGESAARNAEKRRRRVSLGRQTL